MGDVVDLAKRRQKKAVDEELARGRTPLYVSHDTGKITGSPHMRGPRKGDPVQDFGERLARIRASLQKINTLMAELKQMSAGETPK